MTEGGIPGSSRHHDVRDAAIAQRAQERVCHAASKRYVGDDQVRLASPAQIERSFRHRPEHDTTEFNEGARDVRCDRRLALDQQHAESSKSLFHSAVHQTSGSGSPSRARALGWSCAVSPATSFLTSASRHALRRGVIEAARPARDETSYEAYSSPRRAPAAPPNAAAQAPSSRAKNVHIDADDAAVAVVSAASVAVWAA